MQGYSKHMLHNQAQLLWLLLLRLLLLKECAQRDHLAHVLQLTASHVCCAA
jgi:hypothetical protein